MLLLSACAPEPEPETPTEVEAAPSVCDDLGLPSRPFEEAEESDALYAVASDITLETTTGEWSLGDTWTGCDNHLFIQDQPAQATGWPRELWERDVDDLFEALPPNVQLFFVSTERSEEDRLALLAELQEEVEDAIEDLDAVEWWTPRVHYVTERDGSMEGWLGDLMNDPAWGVALDRFQRIRYIGSYADWDRYNSSYGWFEPNLSMVANEAVYYDFEADREAALQIDGATIVTVFDGETVSGSVTTETELPTGDFDTLTIDATMGCGGEGEYGYCPAWDYMAYLYMGVEAVSYDNPYAGTACQAAVAETLGLCSADGVATETTCSDASTCEDGSGATWTCEGYTAAVAADTQSGPCYVSGGSIPPGTYTCNAAGTGYDDLVCPTEIEVARWITTYHREGRWVYDISAMLPFMGGTKSFRFETSGPYTLQVDLRFSNQGKDAAPSETHYAFAGGWIDVNYNAGYEPWVFDVPADATKVELATVISQHGADGNNCGEFCDIAHHFTVNGDTSAEVVRDFPEASTATDCMEKVAEGTVPNQYGTWWYGRAGWCPGKEVPTVMHDLTDQVEIGGENTLEYRALYEGQDYTGGATIRMQSWVVVSR